MYTDLLIKIKNAQAVGKKNVRNQFSRMDKTVADILCRAGFVEGVEVKGRLSKRVMYIGVGGSKRKIEGVKIWSKPSVKRYIGYKDIRPAKGGYGLVMLTTSRGVMTGEQAKREKTGGQILFEIW